MNDPRHVPVLLDRVVALLAPALTEPGSVVIDATLGLGGHSEALLTRCPEAHLIGVDRDHALPDSCGELTRITAELQLFAVHAQEAALRLMSPQATSVDRPAPTARELETLRWTMEGKTAWEVGRILGISEQTVARHLHNATRKLDAVNKHQAVIKALRQGLLN